MSRVVCVTQVMTIELDGSEWDDMSDEELAQQFDEYSLDDWRWDDSSISVEVFPTEEVYLGDRDE